MAKPSLDGVDAKLGRAREHLEALYDEVNGFLSRKPHELIEDTDQEARTFRVSIKIREEPDELGWGLLLGDFAHNLRSSLDHLVWQLVLLAQAKPGRENQFPIAMSGGAYWCPRKDGTPGIRARSLKGVSEKHRTMIDQTQPYTAGQLAKQHPLAILGDLSNVDKHRLLHPTFIAVEAPTRDDIDVASTDEGAIAHIVFNSGPLKDGAEVMHTTFGTTDPNAKVHMKAEIPIRIAFGEDSPVKAEALGDPVLKYVDAIVKAFRREFP